MFRGITIGWRQGNTDAGTNIKFTTVDQEGAIEVANNSGCRSRWDRRILRVDDGNSKLVSAQSRDQIDFTRAVLQAATDLDQQLVTGHMPESIVHNLEVVEVQVQNGEMFTRACKP